MNYHSAIENHASESDTISAAGRLAESSRSNGKGRRSLLPLVLSIGFAFALVILGYQNLVTIPTLQKPQVLTAAPPMLRAARSARETRGQPQSGSSAAVTITVPDNTPVRIAFDIPPGGYDSYSVEVSSQSGAKKLSSIVSAENAKDTLQVLFPMGTLEPGYYNVVIRGISATGSSQLPLANYSFELRFRNGN